MTYNDYIQEIIKTRGQWNMPAGTYFEGHHIIPKCLGGTGNSKRKDQNIIWLTPEEHYEAHKLLALEHPENSKIVYAWHMMCFKKNNGRKYAITAVDSNKAKQLCNNLKSKPIICIETQEIFKSIQSARNKYPTEGGNISQAVLGKRNKAAGYHWAYLADTIAQQKYKNFIGKERQIKKIKIICIETQEVFNSVIEAAKAKNIGRPNISYCLNYFQTTAGGYHWVYASDLAKQKELAKFIGQPRYDWKTNFIEKYGHTLRCIELNKIFKSAKDAARYINSTKNLNISSANIMYCCRGKRKTTGGYHWEFVNKETN